MVDAEPELRHRRGDLRTRRENRPRPQMHPREGGILDRGCAGHLPGRRRPQEGPDGGARPADERWAPVPAERRPVSGSLAAGSSVSVSLRKRDQAHTDPPSRPTPEQEKAEWSANLLLLFVAIGRDRKPLQQDHAGGAAEDVHFRAADRAHLHPRGGRPLPERDEPCRDCRRDAQDDSGGSATESIGTYVEEGVRKAAGEWIGGTAEASGGLNSRRMEEQEMHMKPEIYESTRSELVFFHRLSHLYIHEQQRSSHKHRGVTPPSE